MRIAALHTYPVKGCRGLDHAAAVVEPWGLAGDRRWMMVDADGVGITQRDTTLLTQIRARSRPGGLLLTAPGISELDVAEPIAGPVETIRVFRSHPPAPVRVAESSWSTAFLGRPARLVWQADPTGRAAKSPGLASDPVNLADGFPLLLATTASLDALNDWLAEAGEPPVPMARFRPNIVVSGTPPWAEDGWIGRRLRIGDVTVRAVKSCGRCLVTTIDQETGERGGEPLRTLGRHRRYAGELPFAINLIPEVAAGSAAVVRVGDPVSVTGVADG